MRQLSLVKGEGTTEKRLFPRFPFCSLTFKADNKDDHAFEVKDISLKGMQLGLRDGEHSLKEKEIISGTLHWLGQEMKVKGAIQWGAQSKIGLKFNQSDEFEAELKNFLSTDNLVKGMKPLHEHRENLDLPLSLKYWLKADSPCELFVWQDDHGHISNFQILMLNHFIEWKNGEGIKTGETLNRSPIDSPLSQQNEFMVRYDSTIDLGRLTFAHALVGKMTENHLDSADKKLIVSKLAT